MKVVHSAAGYTLYEVIEIVELVACYRLHHGFGNALISAILLNKCVVVRQVITELNLIKRKSFTVNQKNVVVVSFDGEIWWQASYSNHRSVLRGE